MLLAFCKNEQDWQWICNLYIYLNFFAYMQLQSRKFSHIKILIFNTIN